MVDILLGISSIVIGAAINNLGIVLQKRQINLKEGTDTEKTPVALVSYTRDPIWILGIIMQTILIWPFLVVGLDNIGVTLAQPLSNSGIIILIIGLVWVLDERLDHLETTGALLLIIGVISIGFGGVTGDITQTTFLNETSFQNFGWFMTALCVLVVALVINLVYLKKLRPATLGLLAGVCYAIVSISMQIFTISLEDLSTPVTLFIFVVGLVGTIIGTAFGILTTQEAFKLTRAVNVIPFMQMTMILLPIVAGVWVFNQVILEPLFFWMGVTFTMVGASLLSRFQR